VNKRTAKMSTSEIG